MNFYVDKYCQECYSLVTKGSDEVNRGEIYLILSEGTGHEQKGYRPCVIVQNDLGNYYSPTSIVAYLSTSSKKDLPTHVAVECWGLHERSIVMLEQLQTVDKERLHRMIGTLPKEKMKEINKALTISLGLEKEDQSCTIENQMKLIKS